MKILIPRAPARRLGLDIDGTLSNIYLAVLDEARRRDYGHLPSSWLGIDNFEEPFCGFNDLYKDLETQKQFWLSMPSIEIPSFKPYCYLTARPQVAGMVEITRKWLRLNRMPVAPVILVAHGAYGKALAFQQLRLEALYEDNPEIFTVLRDLNLNCKLVDRPWNQGVSAGEHRVKALAA
jgi:uncharacterized HAD superfamily protein